MSSGSPPHSCRRQEHGSPLREILLQSIAVDMQSPGLEPWTEAQPDIFDSFQKEKLIPLYFAAAFKYCKATASEFDVVKWLWHVHSASKRRAYDIRHPHKEATHASETIILVRDDFRYYTYDLTIR
jgi:hypothetical protein